MAIQDKKSFKIDFNKFISGQNYDGIKKLNFSNGFKDPTFLREKLFFLFFLIFCSIHGQKNLEIIQHYLSNQIDNESIRKQNFKDKAKLDSEAGYVLKMKDSPSVRMR